jgi:hypothetical protein
MMNFVANKFSTKALTMNIYQIEILGQVDVTELNPSSPHQMIATRIEPTKTLVRVCTDQSGFIGLLRHLHGLGLELLSMSREDLAIEGNS